MTSTSKDEDFRSVSGQSESAEPHQSNGNGHLSQDTAATGQSGKAAPTSSRTSEPVFQSSSKQPRRSPHSLVVSASASTAASPFSSRDSSPARPHPRHNISGVSAKVRSRRNSHDVSPNRPPSIAGSSVTVPSAAAIQRALSSTGMPQLNATPASESRLPRASKSAITSPGEHTTPHWPISPRIKSPPPSASSRRNTPLTARKSEPGPSTPNIVVQRSSPAASAPSLVGNIEDTNDGSEDQPPITMKGSSRGPSGLAPTLETVQESSLPNTPQFGISEEDSMTPKASLSQAPTSDQPTKVTEDLGDKRNKAAESGNESGGNKSDSNIKRNDSKTAVSSRSQSLPVKDSLSPLTPIKSRSGAESSTQNMTVETETVNTNPQAAMGPPGDWAAPNRNDPNGSLRMKQSTETIRPKKERKRPARKAPSIHTGTTSSKADFFEAKVADAVGEANSSESDETFVYESNPPDPPSRPSRHHSRTPSTTSMASIGDPRIAMRSIGNVFDGQRGVAGKRSMKFTNNTYNVFDEDNDEEDRADMTPRGATMRSGVGSSAHHHIGRHGRTGAAGHGGIFEHESPFSAAKARGISSNPSRQSSRPNSPKLTNNQRSGNGQIQRNQSGQTSKLGEFSGYELEGEGADDERTPLMGTIRTNRSRAPRRSNNTNTRQIEHYQRQRRSRISQAAGCFILVVMAVLIVAGAVGFLLATTKQLYGVQVEEIKGVLASEQEIMLDLVIQAINPNVMTINVGDMDVNIFAKSKHVGSEKWWREHGQPPPASIGKISRRNRTRSSSIYRTSDNVDEGTDPIDSQDPQTMLLGRIYHFDSGLTFEGTPLKRYPQISIGEIRLAKPGNKTEAGGTERWERVLQYPFELIVRGILKYELPLSSHTITARIGASVIVHPEDVDRKGAMRVEKVAYEWDEEIADDEDGIEE